MKNFKFNLSSKKGWIIFYLVIIYTAIFFSIACLKYQSFSFHDMDLAAINQTFWNSLHGTFISPHYGEPALFSGHKWLIIIPLLPLYAIFPSPLTLLFLQSLALGLGGWAVYLLGREILDNRWGLLFVFCYLIYPPLNYVNLSEFHPIAFATPFLLFTFYFYQKRHWGLFLTFVLLSLSVREDVAIPVFGIGLFALLQGLLQRENKFWPRFKWGLVPLLLAIFWFESCTKFIYILINEITGQTANSTMVATFYGWIGVTPQEIIKNIILHPGKILSGVLIQTKLIYVFYLLFPLGLVSLLSPSAFIMVLVALMEPILSSRFAHFSIRYHYSSIITPFIFISAVYGVRNVLHWGKLRRYEKYLIYLLLFTALISAVSIGPVFNIAGGLKQWQITPEDELRQKLINRIPPLVPVISTFEFTPKLSMRPTLCYFYQVYGSLLNPYYLLQARVAQQYCQWALIDFDDWFTFYIFYTPGGDQAIYRFLNDGKWRLENTVNSIALFQKGNEANIRLVGDGSKEKPDHPAEIMIVPQIVFSGHNLNQTEVLDAQVIDLEVYFKCLGKISKDYLLIARFTHPGNPPFSFDSEFLAPYFIYPSSRWRGGETVKQKCNILVPRKAPNGEYDLTLGILSPIVEGVDFSGQLIYQKSDLLTILSQQKQKLFEEKIFLQKKNAIFINDEL